MVGAGLAREKVRNIRLQGKLPHKRKTPKWKQPKGCRLQVAGCRLQVAENIVGAGLAREQPRKPKPKPHPTKHTPANSQPTLPVKD